MYMVRVGVRVSIRLGLGLVLGFGLGLGFAMICSRHGHPCLTGCGQGGYICIEYITSLVAEIEIT